MSLPSAVGMKSLPSQASAVRAAALAATGRFSAPPSGVAPLSASTPEASLSFCGAAGSLDAAGSEAVAVGV